MEEERNGKENGELPKNIRYMVSLRILVITTKQMVLQENGIGCLTSFRFLEFYECANIKYLLEDMQGLTSLRTMIILEFRNLISLPQGLKYLTAFRNFGDWGLSKP